MSEKRGEERRALCQSWELGVPLLTFSSPDGMPAEFMMHNGVQLVCVCGCTHRVLAVFLGIICY